MGSCVKITPMKNRLGALLRMPGGIRREEALDAAGKNVETLRDEFVAAIPNEIAALESMVKASGRQRISAEELDALLRRAGQLLTLSGTFGYDRLDLVVKRFCDLACGMIEKNIDDMAPVNVHLRAMRLMCPGGRELTEVEAGHVLAGLESVQTHYGITRIQLAEDQAGGAEAKSEDPAAL
jgi:hypothetical protein